MSKSRALGISIVLEFTPLEFETQRRIRHKQQEQQLEFTPLEFETSSLKYIKVNIPH